MIDLHMHSNNSIDSDIDIETLLKECQKLGLSAISITDHNTVTAYKQLENKNVRSLFKGKILAGVEFSAVFENGVIDILGYGFDYKLLNNNIDPTIKAQ